MKQARKSYTVLVVPERSAAVRRFKIAHTRLVQIGGVLVGLLTVAAMLLVHYAYVVEHAGQAASLKNENVALRSRLRVVQDEIARIDGTLQRIDQFASRVRAITQLNDPDRNLAIGPLSGDGSKAPQVLYALGERIENEDEMLDSKLALRMIDNNLEHLEGETLRQEDNLRQLHDYFDEAGGLLAATPSIRPTRSRLVSSGFGARVDPYTEHPVMHKGIDFAADHGADVVATADGMVVFVGSRGNGYGKTVVVDHGYGVQTHYAHLSDFRVRMGERVQRGNVIAAVGNTGRTTGAHLHYEVRFSAIPQDPEKFILD